MRPDVVLLDVMMPGVDGLEVCRRLRADPRTAGAAVLMLTARSRAEDAIVGLQNGADDYIVKPFDGGELVARVRAALRRSQLLRDVSPLTGLPGNGEILRQLERQLDGGRGEVAFGHADLDHFKAFNDRYGFVRGDAAIVATAELLCGVVDRLGGPEGFVGHIGGDDFALVMRPERVALVCATIIEEFDALAPSLHDPADAERGWVEVDTRRDGRRRVGLLSISIGVATTGARPITTVAQLSAVASELKGAAKAVDGSAFSVDRRRGEVG